MPSVVVIENIEFTAEDLNTILEGCAMLHLNDESISSSLNSAVVDFVDHNYEDGRFNIEDYDVAVRIYQALQELLIDRATKISASIKKEFDSAMTEYGFKEV